MSQNTNGNGIGFLSLLAIVFIVLKLTGNIAWSWWWVVAPLWIPVAIVSVVGLIFVVTLLWKIK